MKLLWVGDTNRIVEATLVDDEDAIVEAKAEDIDADIAQDDLVQADEAHSSSTCLDA